MSVEVTNTGKLVTGTSLTINPSDVVNVRSNLDFQNIEDNIQRIAKKK